MTFNFLAGATTTLTSFGGPITLASDPIVLSSGTDLIVITNGGNFSFDNIVGSTSEQVIINTAAGDADLRAR